MRSWHRLIGPLRHSLAEHLDRLRRTFDTIRVRLRDAVVHTVGETVGAAVREALGGVLSEPAARYEEPDYRPRPTYRSTPLWEEPEEPPWPDDPRQPSTLDDEDEACWSDDPPQPSQQRPARCIQAVAVGCEMAAWWLRKQMGRSSLLTAMCVGLASAATAYTAGPVAVAAAGLLGSALSLALLSNALHSAMATLTAFSTS